MCKMVTLKLNNKDIKVANIKVDAIKNAVENISQLKGIDHAILFGSALETRCTEDSDVDIALFGNMTETQFYNQKSLCTFKRNLASGIDLKESYDILYFQNKDMDSDSMIMREIREKGKEIYAIQ